MNSARNERGFSLTEVLVVVAIIAVLISILLPSLFQSKEMANRMVCATHQSAIMTGVMHYVRDNEGFFPPALYNNGSDDHILFAAKFWETDSSAADWDASGFDLLIRNGLVEAHHFQCPSDTDNVFPDEPPFGSSYGMNTVLYQDNMRGWGGEFKGRKQIGTGKGHKGGYGRGGYGPLERDIRDPADTAYLMDKMAPGIGARTQYDIPIVNQAYAYRYPEHAINRHAGVIISGMCDGSVFIGRFDEFYLGVEFIAGWSCAGLLARPISDGGAGFDNGRARDPGPEYTTPEGYWVTQYVANIPRMGGMVQQPFRPQD